MLILMLLLSQLVYAQTSIKVIGTGSVVGLYYPVGGAVSLISNSVHNDLLLTVQVTPGSVANIRALAERELHLALAQSDVVYEAYHGENAFLGQPIRQLRTLLGLHAEPLHLVCTRASGIQNLADLEGKTVNLGPAGSGILNTVRTVLAVYEQKYRLSFEALYESPDRAVEMLVAGNIDCFFYTVGIGGTAIRATAVQTPVTLVSFETIISDLLIEAPYYASITIPAGTYEGVYEDVTTVGVKALLVATTDLSEEEAFAIVKANLDDFETLKATHPALANLQRDRNTEGFGIPLHPGAERAFKALGYLQ